jgi:gamma-glutamyl-gamma-aminobutyrate hydrolase PuuD
MKRYSIIGVSDNYGKDEHSERCHNLKPGYVTAIAEAGGLPLIMPCTDDYELLRATIEEMDGVLLSGGGDLNPKLWGEENAIQNFVPNDKRDRYDMMIVQICREIGKPILAICRGLQCLNVAFGGTLYQDIYKYVGIPEDRHKQKVPTEQGVHRVTFVQGTKTSALAGKEPLITNSHHHQAVNRVGEGLTVTGRSDDGVVEAMEAVDYPFVAFQFHPERMTAKREFAGIFEKWIRTLKQ